MSILVAVLIIGLVFFSSSIRRSHSVPAFEKYAYTDIQGHKYSIVLRNGKISDSSFLYSGKDSLIEAKSWAKSDSIPIKAQSKVEAKAASPDTSGKRSTESILKTIRSNTLNLRKTYNKHLRNGTFSGKITLRIKIAPGGSIVSLYLMGNTTGNQEFALDVLKEVDSWKFEPVVQNLDDVVTVPFTFSE